MWEAVGEGGLWGAVFRVRILYLTEGFSLKRSVCILNIIFTGKFNSLLGKTTGIY